MTPQEKSFELLAPNLIHNLEKRNMAGIYCKTSAECVKTALSMMPKGSTISWGGSESIKECGLLTAVLSENYECIDRSSATTPQMQRELYAKTTLSDYYLMSSNALTLDGELVNIDGNGNRVACLIQGPSHVFLIVGRNKIVADPTEGVTRIRAVACPPNAVRLGRNIPCGLTGSCHDCLSKECFCNQIVITRRSNHEGRITVFLVNDLLGY